VAGLKRKGAVFICHGSIVSFLSSQHCICIGAGGTSIVYIPLSDWTWALIPALCFGFSFLSQRVGSADEWRFV
jgi:hypothetical protein